MHFLRHENKVNENKVLYCKALRCETIKNNKKLLRPKNKKKYAVWLYSDIFVA